MTRSVVPPAPSPALRRGLVSVPYRTSFAWAASWRRVGPWGLQRLQARAGQGRARATPSASQRGMTILLLRRRRLGLVDRLQLQQFLGVLDHLGVLLAHLLDE